MRFGELPTAEALGGRLAHSLRPDGGARVPKGTLLDAALVETLLGAGVERVTAALPDADDVHEDEAAARVVRAFVGTSDGLRVDAASTGRANVFATRDGLFAFDRDAVLAANAVDEGVTLATLAENLVVPAGRMVATVKIVPFAVPGSAVAAACDALAHGTTVPGGRAAAVHGFVPRRAALVQTVLPTLSGRALDKTRRVTEARLEARGAALVVERRCAHGVDALAAELGALPPGIDWVLVVGASAIADRRDVIPAGVERAGGEVHRLGLGVDPGNLLMLGGLGGRTVLGLPGCARSPADNGVDRLLDRLACDVGIDEPWLRSLAVGGLLGEIVERPSPRRSAESPVEPSTGVPTGAPTHARRRDRVAVLVLAAGASRRAGPTNKLLHPIARPGSATRAPMVRATVERALEAGLGEVVVVTGHEADAVGAALDGLDVRLVHNPAAAGGMASSLVRGVSALASSARPADAVLVCLADMPLVRSGTLVALVDAWRAHPDAHAVVPTHGGRRGNPVLLGRGRFDDVLSLAGDVGARSLLRGDGVLELDVDDPGVLIDHDTPEALAARDAGDRTG